MHTQTYTCVYAHIVALLTKANEHLRPRGPDKAAASQKATDNNVYK